MHKQRSIVDSKAPKCTAFSLLSIRILTTLHPHNSLIRDDCEINEVPKSSWQSHLILVQIPKGGRCLVKRHSDYFDDSCLPITEWNVLARRYFRTRIVCALLGPCVQNSTSPPYLPIIKSIYLIILLFVPFFLTDSVHPQRTSLYRQKITLPRMYIMVSITRLCYLIYGILADRYIFICVTYDLEISNNNTLEWA